MRTRHRIRACVRATLAGGLILGLGGHAAFAAGPTEIAACTTITKSGSYVLTSNLTPAAPGNCIVVAADFVTIDLNGFTIRGNTRPPIGKEGSGITTLTSPSGDLSGHRATTVRNGAITDFEFGILLYGPDLEVERIRAISNSDGGIIVLGGDGGTMVVRDCTVTGNGHGIDTATLGAAALIANNVASF
jgi:hypothetical protein